ncbi:MAG TPA: isopentenyl phosphate kinase [Thermoplasmata archaeon]|nr:isopentenyl phosphate kinase [Thermoplasmata archaeon]
MTGRGSVLIKLGGSVITDKAVLRTFRNDICRRLARELSAWDETLAVVHGAGSFGHILAKEHRLHEGFRDESQLKQVALVQRDVRELNIRVLEALIDNGVRAVSVPPAAVASFDRGKVVDFDPALVDETMALGLTPVTFGDVVPDESMRFSICSGDLMMYELARHLKPRKAIFCADVDGVFTSDPKKHDDARLIPMLDREAVAGIKRDAPVSADVTGSIHGKLEMMLAIAGLCEKCMILNGNVPGRLESALRGEDVPSTTVLPG